VTTDRFVVPKTIVEKHINDGDAFMRSGEDPSGDPANVAARNDAWERMKKVLETL